MVFALLLTPFSNIIMSRILCKVRVNQAKLVGWADHRDSKVMTLFPTAAIDLERAIATELREDTQRPQCRLLRPQARLQQVRVAQMGTF